MIECTDFAVFADGTEAANRGVRENSRAVIDKRKAAYFASSSDCYGSVGPNRRFKFGVVMNSGCFGDVVRLGRVLHRVIIGRGF